MTKAHDQRTTHRYTVHYPNHEPRSDDPHYVDFNAYRRAHIKTAKCFIGERIGFQDCAGVLELHHANIEFALQNGVSLAALEHDYPGVSDPDSVGAWVESGKNLRFLCTYHHRGGGGCHLLSHSDWQASQYVPGLTKP